MQKIRSLELVRILVPMGLLAGSFAPLLTEGKTNAR